MTIAHRLLPLLGDHRNGTECPEGVPWIYNWFGDCVDTNLKLVGFSMGILSMILWFFPPFPQLLKNYQTKQCNGLSFLFLFFWMAGDTCNTIGTLLTHQLLFMKIIGIYYSCVDVVMMSQYFYYTRVYAGRHRPSVPRPPTVVPVVLLGAMGGATLLQLTSPPSFVFNGSVGRTVGDARGLTEFQQHSTFFQGYSDLLGFVLGSLASICSLTSRVPQIRRNHQRQSCEGLSPVMFGIILAANITYSASVLLESDTWFYLMRRLPWLGCSLGCICFDFVILYQYRRFHKFGVSESDEDDDRVQIVSDEA